MNKVKIAVLLLAFVALATEVNYAAEESNPDSIFLRKPSRRRNLSDRLFWQTGWKSTATRTNEVTRLTYVTQTNVVTQTDYVTRTNVVTKTDYVMRTNVVTKTDYVVQTNRVTHTEFVTKTNVVTQIDYVLHTNRVTDVVQQTNVVTRTDYVVLTNVVVKTTLDERARLALEAERNAAERRAAIEEGARQNAEEARTAAEKTAVQERSARVQAEAEMARMREQLARAEAAREQAEKKLTASETKVAVAERKAEAAENARAEVAAQIDAVARKALDERKARERAEAEQRAAEQRAENERVAALAVAKKLDTITNAPPPTIETPDYAPDQAESPVAKTAATNAVPAKKVLTGRDAIITADRMDFDRKEGILLFDKNVYVDDEQYQMHADRLFVFLQTNAVTKVENKKKKDAAGGLAGFSGGTSLKRLVAIGHVSITNDQRSAYCARATYAKATGKIVMYGSDEITPWILDPQQSKTPQYGEKITFWTISQQVEVDKPVLSGAALGKGKEGNPLDAFKK